MLTFERPDPKVDNFHAHFSFSILKFIFAADKKIFGGKKETAF